VAGDISLFGNSLVVILILFLASAGIMEMNILAVFARFVKGLNLVDTSVRYRVIMLRVVEYYPKAEGVIVGVVVKERRND
jgi:hypothetical protein